MITRSEILEAMKDVIMLQMEVIVQTLYPNAFSQEVTKH